MAQGAGRLQQVPLNQGSKGTASQASSPEPAPCPQWAKCEPRLLINACCVGSARGQRALGPCSSQHGARVDDGLTAHEAEAWVRPGSHTWFQDTLAQAALAASESNGDVSTGEGSLDPWTTGDGRP